MTTPWHQALPPLQRFVQDLVTDEVAQLRPGGLPLPPTPWAPDLLIAEAGLGLDSLERLALAATLCSTLHLHRSAQDLAIYNGQHVGDWWRAAQQGLSLWDAELTFRTSGSSGRPKPCLHSLALLEEEAAHLATLFEGARRVLCAVPAHHIYGFLFTVLLPRHLPACADVVDVRQTSPATLQDLLQAGDLLIGHPAHWAMLARHAVAWPEGVRGVTSTAPCPPGLAQDLIDQGLQRLTQVYGSSETAGIGWRHAPDAPYTLMPHWQSVPDAGGDHAGQTVLARTATDGVVQQHRLQDQLAWLAPRAFQVQGRLDQAVQVGGVNVFPARVQAVLLQHPDVAQAQVRLMPPQEGARLKAFIVPQPHAERATLPQRLDAWLHARLSAPERPKAFTLGDALPVNHLGKASDWPLTSLVAPPNPGLDQA